MKLSETDRFGPELWSDSPYILRFLIYTGCIDINGARKEGRLFIRPKIVLVLEMPELAA